MNRELTKVAPNSSYISILVNRQSFLTSLVAHQVLEKICTKFLAILTIFLHILAQNFSRWPKIFNIVCLLTKTVTREQSQSIFITSELIPFLWERLKLCPSDQKYKISWTTDPVPNASNHFINLKGHHSWGFGTLKIYLRFIPFLVNMFYKHNNTLKPIF